MACKESVYRNWGFKEKKDDAWAGRVRLDIQVGNIKKRHGIVIGPYNFMSKTHSLSTEDLGKCFIHWFMYLLLPREHFASNRKTAIKSGKMARKLGENKWKLGILLIVAMNLERLYSGSISKYRKIAEIWPETRKQILKK